MVDFFLKWLSQGKIKRIQIFHKLDNLFETHMGSTKKTWFTFMHYNNLTSKGYNDLQLFHVIRFTFAAILSYTWRLNILIKSEYHTNLSRLKLRLFIFSFLWNTLDWWEDEYKLAKIKTTNIYLNTVKIFMFQFPPYNFTAVSSTTLADTAFPVAIFRKQFAFC